MTQSVTDVTTRDLASRIDDAAGLMAYAAESFAKLSTLTAAAHALVDDAELGRRVARIASDLAEELADSFDGFRREYNIESRRIHNAEQSSSLTEVE